MSSSKDGSMDQEIERLRRKLKRLESQSASSHSKSGSTTDAGDGNLTPPRRSTSTTRRRRFSGTARKDSFAFAHLSTSSRNLGARQPSSDNLMKIQPSRSMSMTSNGGSVGGVFGDSDDEYSDDDDAKDDDGSSLGLLGGLARQNDHSFSQFEQLNQSFGGGTTTADGQTTTFGLLKRNDSYDARKGSDDDKMLSKSRGSNDGGRGLSRTLSSDDDMSSPSLGRGVLRSRRQNSYRNIRAISMPPVVAPDDADDDDVAVDADLDNSSDEDVYTKAVAPPPPPQPFLQRNLVQDFDNDYLDDMSTIPLRPLATGEKASSVSSPSRGGGAPRNLARKVSSIPRRSSYENVMPLSIGPGGQAAIMESNKLDYVNDYDDDKEYDGSFVDDFSNEERTPTFETLCAPSFSQFAMLQIQPEQLLLVENEYLFFDDGPTHLDSFLLNQEMEFGDHYTAHANRPIDPASVSAFCFPDGLRVRYLPKAGFAGAQRMGWIGPKGDRCHVIVFTNGSGITDHGVAITIQWEVNLKKNERQILSGAVYTRRKRRRASRKIQHWWRHHVQDRVLREALAISGFAGHSPADLKGELVPSELKLLEQALKHTGVRSLMDQSPRSKSKAGSAARRQMMKKGISQKISKALNRKTYPIPEVDTSAVEVVTRAAIMRSPSSPFRNDSNSSGGEDVTTDDEGAIGGSARGFALLKRVSSRGSGRLSLRSLNSNRSMLDRTTSQSLSPPQAPRSSGTMKRLPSARCIELARESYETMKENDRMGSICVVEKCYTLIGCQPDEHVLLLGPLQQLINSERDEVLAFRRSRNDIKIKKRPKERTIDDIEEERRLELELKSRRHIVIKAMREKLRLTTRQALVTFPRSQLEHINGKLHYFEAFIPQIPNCDTVKLPLPLPRIGKEWALAQFLLDIGPDSLVLCLKLMLLERSILVLGDNLQHVSMYACGLIELLRPFEWASAFMPVLPHRMLDFINSPVPFIAGVAARNISEIENDSRVLEAMGNGMSLLNLKTKTLHITTEKGINKMISLDPYLRENLKQLRGRLQHFVQRDPQSPLRNFKTFFQFGLSRRESVTLRSVCRVLEHHFTHFCGDLAVNDKAWQRYGTIDMETDEFMFNPDWFLNPIRADQAFHECMVKTQLFAGYVHERREDQIEMREIMEGELGYFIADWVYDKWMSKVPPSHRHLTR